MALKQLYKNLESYKTLLDTLSQEEMSSPVSKQKQLRLFSQTDRVRVSTEVHQPNLSGRMDLVFPTDSSKPNEREEVICHVQGYALRLNLPPIVNKNQLTKHPVAAKQSIVMTGLGADCFDECARGILEVHAKLSAALPSSFMQEWKPITDNSKICLEFSNRYFATDRDGLNLTDIPLGTVIDPFGILANEVPEGRHTEDNQVLYFDRIPSKNNHGYRHIPCPPSAIRVGQLVEAQIAFCAVPVGKGRFRMIIKLRALCILSRQVQKDIDDSVIRGLQGHPISPMKKVKRRVGYRDECHAEQKETEADMKRLRLDDKDDDSTMSA